MLGPDGRTSKHGTEEKKKKPKTNKRRKRESGHDRRGSNATGGTRPVSLEKKKKTDDLRCEKSGTWELLPKGLD